MSFNLRRREDGAYPIPIEQFIGMYPDASVYLPSGSISLSSIETYGYDVVLHTNKPEMTFLDKVKEGKPEFNTEEQAWYQTWLVEDVSSSLDQAQVSIFIAQSKVNALGQLEKARLKAEGIGIVRHGNFIPTDVTAFTDITGTLMYLQIEPEHELHWPTPIGGWMTVDLQFLTQVFRAMHAHRQRCRKIARQAYEALQTQRHPNDMQTVLNNIKWPD